MSFTFAKRLPPTVRGYPVLGLKGNAGELFDRSRRHELIQESDHRGQQPVEQDTGVRVQPSRQELLQPPGIPAALAIRRLQNPVTIGAGQAHKRPLTAPRKSNSQGREAGFMHGVAQPTENDQGVGPRCPGGDHRRK